MFRNKKVVAGFTLIEILVSLVIFVIIISAMTSTLTVALSSNKRQKEANLSQTLASSVMNSKVISQSYDYLYNYVDCHSYSLKDNGIFMMSNTAGGPTTATQTEPSPYCPITGWNNSYIYIPVSSGSGASLADPGSFPEIRKLENGSAEIQLYPINKGTSATPVIDPDQFSAKVIVRWGKKATSGIPINKFEIATSVAKDGYFNSVKAAGCTSDGDCPSGQFCKVNPGEPATSTERTCQCPEIGTPVPPCSEKIQ